VIRGLMPLGVAQRTTAKFRHAFIRVIRGLMPLGVAQMKGGVTPIRFGLKLSRINYRESKSLIFDTSSFM